MSSTNGNGKGNILIAYSFKGDTPTEQIDEERRLMNELSQFMAERGYQYILADDDYINEKLLGPERRTL